MIQKKSLLVLVAAGLLSGCGYDDGDDGKLHALPAQCRNSTDCVDLEGVILGVCEEGMCKRVCNETNDCDSGAVCESHVCRQVVDCPVIEHYDLSGNAVSRMQELNNSKCIKVFKNTLNVNWSAVLNDDLHFNKSLIENIGNTNDFTSDNFNLTVLKKYSTGNRMNFGFVFYLGSLYFITIKNVSDALAECYKPQLFDKGYVDISKYKASYKYDYSYDVFSLANRSNPAKMLENVQNVCSSPFHGMSEDMQTYAKESTKEGEKIDYDAVLKNYLDMIVNKKECTEVLNLLQRMGAMGQIVASISGQDSSLTSVIKDAKDYVTEYDAFELNETNFVNLTEENYSYSTGINIPLNNVKQANKQMELCYNTMKGVAGNNTMGKMFINQSTKLNTCISKNIEAMFIGEGVNTDIVRNTIFTGSFNSIAAVANPNYVWFDSESFQGISVTVNKDVYTGDLSPKGFILEGDYTIPAAMFDENVISDSVLMGYPDYAFDKLDEDPTDSYVLAGDVKTKYAYSYYPFYRLDKGTSKKGYSVYDFGCLDGSKCKKDLFTMFYKVYQKDTQTNGIYDGATDPHKYDCGGLVVDQKSMSGYLILGDNVKPSTRAVAKEKTDAQ